MKKKLLSVLLATAMVATVLAGCGKTEEAATPAAEEEAAPAEEEAAPAEEEAAPAEEEAEAATGVPTYTEVVLGETGADITTTLKWLHHKTDRDANSGGDGAIQEYIAAFNEEYPNITIETEAVTDYHEDSLLRLSTGDWGDIMFIPAVDKADLPTYFQPFGTIEDVSTQANFINNWNYEGIAYGIPYMGNAQGVVYNKRIFEEAGVTELPKTGDEFIAALQAVKDNTEAIPLYTNYAAGWTMGAWDAYAGIVSDGDDTYLNQKLVHTAEPFASKEDGSGIYGLYKILYDATANGLIEDDYTTTDWEGCKGMINAGEIGSMVLGSWAFAQMVEAGDQGADIGYMPFPLSVGGTQYALAGGDFNYGINVNSSDDNKTAAMVFIKWMTEKSGWCYNEGGYTVAVDGENPDMYASFDGCTVLCDQPALAGEEDFLNLCNADSELNFNAGGDAKVQAIVEHAANGDMTYDEIMADWTARWNEAQEANDIEILY